MKSLRVVLAAVASLCAGAPVLADAVPLKDGDRVVFYGDSITQQRLYTRYLQQYVYCRYPDLDVRFFNAGWSGDRAPGALNRLERDVLALKPTVVTLFFGMNDGSYKKLEDSIVTTYRDAMDQIIAKLKSEGVRVIVYGPGCTDYDKRENLRPFDYNINLATLSKAAGELAAKHGCEYVDVHGAMIAFQNEQKAENAEFTMIPDGVHPNSQGHLMMARVMLEPFAEPMPPAKVSGVTKNEDGSITATVEDVLPFWIDPASREVAEDSGMLAFAAPTLTLNDLPEGAYDVSINGLSSAQATAADLKAGVPLAVNLPLSKRLHDAIVTKENLYFSVWRELQLPLADQAKIAPTVATYLAADEQLQQLILDLGEPTDLQVRITPRPEGVNVALRKPYEASDPNTRNWGTGGLTDGSWEATSKTCFATDTGTTFPKTVTVDLETAVPVDTVILGVPPFGSTKTIAVSVSDDGSTFTDVGRHEFPLRSEYRHTFKFAPQAARYVRLTYLDNHGEKVDYDRNFMFTTELEVYAANGK